ncbi:unnamed protein product, partial [Mesorhabditis belari]|uniref:Uncharacterized protein n=1 Tax=Mesorhabditis belari TaxID=2138241 RepID=A0AAF3EKY6_9BILA
MISWEEFGWKNDVNRYIPLYLRINSLILKRSHPLDSQEGGLLPPHLSHHQQGFDETDYIFMQSKKMLTAAALGAGSSSASAGATTPSSLCSTPVSLLQQSALLPYASAAASTLAASAPLYQQMALQQQLSAGGGLTSGMGMIGGGQGNASYEGIPIFIVPQTGATPGATTVSLAALQKAAEIKATLLANALTEPKVDTSSE